MIKKNKIIVIWDLEASPGKFPNICLWNKRSTKYFSIINYVDKKPTSIIKNLLDYFQKISNANFFLNPLKNYFIFYKNFSYFDLSFVIEKSFYKNNFLEILKVFSLMEVLKKKKIKELKIFSKNENLNKFLKIYCRNNKIVFNQIVKNSPEISVKKLISFLFFFKPCLDILIFLYRRISFNRKNKISFNKNIIFSYSENISKKSSTLLRSRYWANIFQNNSSIFFNIFIPSKKFSTLNKLSKENQSSSEVYLDHQISFSIICKIFSCLSTIYLKNIFLLFFSKKIFFYNKLPMWYFVKKDWKKSFGFYDIFVNLYYFFLIEKTIKFINNPKKCFYLLENQPWERALCFFWKKKFKEKIIGVCHTPLRFWDLRYKNVEHENNKYIRPDIVGLNGKHSFELFKKEFPSQKKIKLEPLRYSLPKKIKNNNKLKKTVIIVGDYLHNINLSIIESLEKVSGNFNFNYVYLPHPSNSKTIISKKLNLKTILNKKKLCKYNTYCFIIPHMSSSALDFYLLSKKIIIFLDNSMPNLSPLYPNKIIHSAHDSKTLQNVLEKKVRSNNIKHMYSNFFYVSKNKNKWNHFLKN